jgi:signal transduction histidine kinase
VVQRVTPIGAQQVAADLAVGVVAVVTVLAITSQIEQSGNDRALDAKAYACMVVAGAVLACKRRWPVATVAAVTAALSFYLARGYPGGPVFVTLFVSLYALARTRRRRVSFTAAAVAAGALVLVGEVAGTGPGLVHLVFVGWAGAAVFLGDAVQSHRDTVDALEERARHLEESRHQDARRQVAEERLRIAQDLHDSVAHSMAVISVQSGVAAHVVDRYPDRAREAMLVVKQSSGEVLDELGALLGLLRLDGEIAAPVAPTPGPGAFGGSRGVGQAVWSRGRPAYRGRHRGHLEVGRCGRVPDRAGVFDQRGQARRARDGGDGDGRGEPRRFAPSRGRR